jgi:UDP-3-O-[3-hydroxymyristoyl] glucosamine N-acyltransferase
MSYTSQQIAELVGGQLIGPGDIAINGMETLDRAGPGQLTFIGGEKFIEAWRDCGARAALVKAGLDVATGDGRALVFVDDVDLATARVLEALAPPPVLPEIGVHESAVIDPTTQIGEQVRIGPGSVIGSEAQIGDGAVIHANVTVMHGSRIGAGCVLWPGVVVRER